MPIEKNFKMKRYWNIFIMMVFVGLILAVIGAYLVMTFWRPIDGVAKGVGISLIVIGALFMLIPICSLEKNFKNDAICFIILLIIVVIIFAVFWKDIAMIFNALM